MPPLIRAALRADARSGFVAECADYPISVAGITREEAAQKLRAAVQTYFEREENPLADYALIIEEA
jgi:predicted RNase H-like HicB family nuclease